ncbi:MAG: formimidoylglutamate deiminase [Acidobacteria bacterium]|nr:formimidoylglutamate deiminase [Acidobacteriota bacterium]
MAPGMLHAADALLPTGWARDVALEWDARGVLVAVRPGVAAPPQAGRVAGPVVPGMPHLHSHAFQRVFAGLAEVGGAGDDSFWSWRERMYDVASTVTPEALDAIATYVYIEMLEHGYTSVCEFHYLHNAPDGRPYADRSTLADAVARAAGRTGIGLTLLPVLYQQSGFGGGPPGGGQRRFVTSTDALLDLVGTLGRRTGNDIRIGLALHSLRAVAPEAMRDALTGLASIDPDAPIHIHVAEQRREVEDCLTWSGQRPVEWLLNHAPVDDRWCLVHATNLRADEAWRAARTGAVAGLCPTTEANLGDGIFDLPAWTSVAADARGRWGVGSDSHVTVDAAEELRMLEYSQRLATRRRNVGASAEQPHVATALTLAAVAGGAAASGRPLGGLTVGQRADLVVLDMAHPMLTGLAAADALDAHVFAGRAHPTVDTVMVGGRIVIERGRHPLRPMAAEAFLAARKALASRQ